MREKALQPIHRIIACDFQFTASLPQGNLRLKVSAEKSGREIP